MPVTNLLQTYAQRVRTLRRANADVAETALAPAFQQLLEGLLALLPAGPGLIVMPEYRNPGVGRPDIALVRQSVPARAFIELKAPAKSADPTRWRAQDKLQFERLRELPCWASSNFAEVRLFHRDAELGDAMIVPERVLRPDQDDGRASRTIADHDAMPFLRLVEMLAAGAGQEPTARDAEHLATLMAHSARLVRGIVKDRLAELREDGNPRHALLQVRQEFRDVLYAHPEAAGYAATDFDALFSAAFAQTLAFGLLLVREGTGQPVGADAWRHMPDEHPLMQTALRVLSLDEVVQDVGIGFEVMRDTVNSFAPEILVAPPGGRDPILYFYEYFLQTFDPEARRGFGVYYTPVEVVRYMVSALDRAVRVNLATQGLRDQNVTILDPATGTGTFLLGIAELVRTQAETEAGEGMAALALQELAHRMFGFELLVGPYAVAHYRLHHTLRRPRREGGRTLELPRLGVYLADTLAEPGAAAAAGPLGFVSEGIADERREANRIKTEQPILAIIGNPPYRRLEEGENRTLVGDWMDEVWDDLKEPVRNAGQGGQLNTFPELSVAFWRWAIWKLFEAENAPRRGVIAFISNRKFLTGWPYAGLRMMMRERFDRIEIIDLRGDVRRGERAGVDADQGVFNIMVGTAVTLAIADGSKTEGELADVLYQDTWTEGVFSRRAKLDWLEGRAGVGAQSNAVSVARGPLDDMRPMPFQNGEWVSLDSCFTFRRSGIQTKRDEFVYSPARRTLTDRLIEFGRLSDEAARNGFASTSARPWNIARVQPFSDELVRRNAYRPLDLRWLYNHPNFIDRPRPELQEVWGRDNICLYAMPNGTGAGPAVWCHGLLPDYHAFRGSYGGYAFPLHDRRPEVAAPNIAPALVESLRTAYGEAVSAEDVFDTILCLLSARSYTLRFAEDLEDVFPHVPFPGRPNIFHDAVRVGHEIRAVETFARPPGGAYMPREFVRVATQPRGIVATVDYADGAIILCADGTGRITGLPQAVWDFSVSGYRLVPRWLEGRVGLPADLALVRELRDICGRIAELIDLFARADIVLETTLHETLTVEALGLRPIEHDANGERD
jgi:hypothetical protein